jgi:high-affinity iron transporter
MRGVVSCVVCLVATLGWASPGSAAPPESLNRPLRQVAGMLEYISGDYRGAVGADAQVLNAAEYEEQASMASDAAALASQAGLRPGDALMGKLDELQQAVREKRAPDEVMRICREARHAIVTDHAITLSPASLPSRSAGQRLYAENGCATCHGVDGGALTDAAAKLDPKPANFLDPERMATVSPYRAFHALSAGVPGTAMQSYGHLRDEDRWSLAFYVLSLRHGTADLAQGKQLFGQARSGLPTRASGLFALTEEDILGQLGTLRDPAQRALVLGYLRAEAPFEAPPSQQSEQSFSLELARREIAQGLAAYRAGDRASARQRFVSAYLDGFEPHEAGLAVRDRELVREVERAMLSLRQATAQGAPLQQIEKLTKQSEVLLLRAEGGRGSPATAFWGALTITLREGLEIALLLTALLALVRKRGQAELTRYVHAGWMLAVAAGFLTWWAASEVLSGMHRELAEGIAALLAAVVLLGVTHWLLGQLTAKRFMGFLADRLGRAASRSAATGVLGLSFIAVYREALEVVLFFQALLLDSGDNQGRVWLGLGVGLFALIVIGSLLKRLGRRMRPRPFMLLSSAMLAALSFVLAGKGIRALQEAGVLGLNELPLPELPWLGIWPTMEGVLVQGAVLLLLIGSALWPVLSQARDASANADRNRGIPTP